MNAAEESLTRSCEFGNLLNTLVGLLSRLLCTRRSLNTRSWFLRLTSLGGASNFVSRRGTGGGFYHGGGRSKGLNIAMSGLWSYIVLQSHRADCFWERSLPARYEYIRATMLVLLPGFRVFPCLFSRRQRYYCICHGYVTIKGCTRC